MLFALAGFLISSCTQDDESQDSFTVSKSKREQARELLNQLNESNPYSKMGIGHNEQVSDYLAEIAMTTRSGDSLTFSQLKQIVSLRVDSMMVIDSIADYTIDEFEEDFDSVMTSYFNAPSEYFQASLQEGNVGESARQYIQRIDRIVNRNGNVMSTLDNLDALQRTVIRDSLCHEQELVLTMISVAANSYEYWDEVNDSIPSVQLSIANAVKADVDMAGITFSGNAFAKLLKKAVSWKYVVAVSAGASVWECVTEINWSGLWDWATSWI